MFLGGVFTFFFVPETKNIPLEAMDSLWAGGHSCRTANRDVMAMLRAQSGLDRGSESGAGELDKADSEFLEKV